MKIKSITLNNIGCFNGSNRFDLTTTESKNYILIEGEQDSGKTTICKALEYALYGLYLKTKDRTPYINNYVKQLFNDAVNINYNIEVVFNIDNSDYTLIRGTYINNNEYLSELLILKCNGEILNNPQIVLNKVYKEYPYEMFKALYIDSYVNSFGMLDADTNHFKSTFEGIFNIDSNSELKYENLLNKVAIITQDLLNGYILGQNRLIITNDFKIEIINQEGRSCYDLSAAEGQILLYVIYYSMIKISNNNNLVILDNPFRSMGTKMARYFFGYILPNISTQTLIFVSPSWLERAKRWNIEINNDKINYRYVLSKLK